MSKLLLLAALASSPTASDLSVKCEMTSMVVCDATSCRSAPSVVTTYMGAFGKKQKHRYYYRCVGNEPCDQYTPLVTQSGQFINVSLTNGAMAKIAPDMSVTDIATLGNTVIINRGICEGPYPPPLVRVNLLPQR